MPTLLSGTRTASALALLYLAAQHAATHAHRHTTMSPLMAFFFHLGIAGLLLVASVDSSLVPLPIPAITDILLIIFAAAHEHPSVLVLVAVCGATAGGFASYTAGRLGGMAFLKKVISEKTLARVTNWVERHNLLAVSIPALLPPPMPLTPFLLAAGAVRMDRLKYILSFSLARLVRYSFTVWIGLHYGRHVLRVWAAVSAKWGTPVLAAIWVIIAIITTYGVWNLWRASKLVRSPAPAATPAAA